MTTYKYFDKNPFIRARLQGMSHDTWIKIKFVTQERIVKKVMQMQQAENRVQWLPFVCKRTNGWVH